MSRSSIERLAAIDTKHSDAQEASKCLKLALELIKELETDLSSRINEFQGNSWDSKDQHYGTLFNRVQDFKKKMGSAQ